MNKFAKFMLVAFPLSVGFLSYGVTHAFFASSATSTGNTFTAMASFPTTPTPTVTPTVSPTPGAGDPYVDDVASVSGTFGHCCSDLSDDPNVARPFVVGPPDANPSNMLFVQLSDTTVMTLAFTDNKAADGAGADIRIHTFDAEFVQKATIAVAQGPDCNAATYTTLGDFGDGADVDLDISGTGLPAVQCVRITDLVEVGDSFPSLGFDLDAIEALHSAAP